MEYIARYSDIPTPLHGLQLVLGVSSRTFLGVSSRTFLVDLRFASFLALLLTAIVGTVCSVYEPVIAWGEIIGLPNVAIVFGCLCDWHCRLLELFAHLRWPLEDLLAVIWE